MTSYGTDNPAPVEADKELDYLLLRVRDATAHDTADGAEDWTMSDRVIAETKTALLAWRDKACVAEFDRGTVFGLLKTLAYLDSQPDKEAVRKLVESRLSKLKAIMEINADISAPPKVSNVGEK